MNVGGQIKFSTRIVDSATNNENHYIERYLNEEECKYTVL